jgi:hypothetical protein
MMNYGLLVPIFSMKMTSLMRMILDKKNYAMLLLNQILMVGFIILENDFCVWLCISCSVILDYVLDEILYFTLY